MFQGVKIALQMVSLLAASRIGEPTGVDTRWRAVGTNVVRLIASNVAVPIVVVVVVVVIVVVFVEFTAFDEFAHFHTIIIVIAEAKSLFVHAHVFAVPVVTVTVSIVIIIVVVVIVVAIGIIGVGVGAAASVGIRIVLASVFTSLRCSLAKCGSANAAPKVHLRQQNHRVYKTLIWDEQLCMYRYAFWGFCKWPRVVEKLIVLKAVYLAYITVVH
jgi:hypothetical protein